jgi:hypothetical protein
MKIKFEFQFLYNDEKPAKETVSLRELKRIIRAIKSPNFTHARFRSWCGGTVSIYHKEPLSPSGVMLAAGGRPALIDPLLKRYKRTSPLSPTEGLMTSR